MMTILPRRRQPARSGIERAEQRVWLRHRKFVRGHSCCVPGCEDGPIDFAHVKTVGSGGHDAQAVSLCRRHHKIQHDIGIATFQTKYGVDLWAIAAAFVRASPDVAMKEAIRMSSTLAQQVTR